MSHIKGLLTDRCQSVVQFLTLTMDIDKQTAPLPKKIQKLQWQIDNAVLSEDQIKEKKEEIAMFIMNVYLIEILDYCH